MMVPQFSGVDNYSILGALSRIETASPKHQRDGRDQRQCSHADQRPSTDAVDASQENSLWFQRGTLQRSGAALQARSTVLRCVGGVSWVANQQHAGGACRVRTLEQLFQETSRRPGATNLERLFGPYGRRSLRSTWCNV
jgi:hypothetical protein